MKWIFYLLPAFLCCMSNMTYGQIDEDVFALLDLDRPGLEKTAALYRTGDIEGAGCALLDYYQTRTTVHPDMDPAKVKITTEQQRRADDALRHVFYVHDGYQPSFFYGDDIDWTYWPVKDNELRWQLHRMKWWVPMGQAYRVSGDGKYAAEWIHQYLDWIEKNPLIEGVPVGDDIESDDPVFRTSSERERVLRENVRFAWRPLEVSDRLEHQIEQLEYFIDYPGFTPAFLSRFLTNYHRHAIHLTANLSGHGNHLLFEAQRLIYAGVWFPEFKDAALWREKGVEILNREIEKQVYDDGMQYELDPHYHLASINIFFKALLMMDANGYRDEFPQSYVDRVENMIVLYYNICFPDYTNPMFSDAKLLGKDNTLPYYIKWARVFPDNEVIRWMATDGKEGKPADNLSKAFTTSGMYVLRNGWDMSSTVMVLKAGPPSFWHNQPDNGTFELWRKGRNFFPDSGSYVYGGDDGVMQLRNWFRQTRVHNTLTLDGMDITGMDSKCVVWETGPETDYFAYVNPSYEGLTHRRSVFFVDRKFFIIVDEATGEANGHVALHYNLMEGDVYTDYNACRVSTLFPDGNNIALQVFGPQETEMSAQDGWVSRSYRNRTERPSFSFTSEKKDDRPVRFITVIIPAEDSIPYLDATFDGDYDDSSLSIKVRVNGVVHELGYYVMDLKDDKNP